MSGGTPAVTHPAHRRAGPAVDRPDRRRRLTGHRAPGAWGPAVSRPVTLPRLRGRVDPGLDPLPGRASACRSSHGRRPARRTARRARLGERPGGRLHRAGPAAGRRRRRRSIGGRWASVASTGPRSWQLAGGVAVGPAGHLRDGHPRLGPPASLFPVTPVSPLPPTGTPAGFALSLLAGVDRRAVR